MPYVLERTDQGGGFVTRPGSRGSYTRDLRFARVFATRAEADANRCPGNECIREVSEVVGRGA